jgi:hypothetical protein
MPARGRGHGPPRLHVHLLHILSTKSLKLVLRARTNLSLFFFAVFGVLGGIFFIFSLFHHQSRPVLTSEPYRKLALDFGCSLDRSNITTHEFGTSRVKCDPMTNNTAALLQSFDTMKSHSPDPHHSRKLLNHLSSLLMNGIPLVGLEDYVRISDLVNRYIGRNTRTYITSSSLLRDQFSNLLDVRDKSLLLTPDNCLTRGFFNHLTRTSNILSTLHIRVLEASEAAEHISDEKVWAILEISPPSSITSADSAGNSTREDLCNLSMLLDSSSSTTNSSIINWEDFSTIYTPKTTIDTISTTFRMPPDAVPDTRNFEWSPLKRNLIREQSGELLYFLSGFMSLQLELENYFRRVLYNTSTIDIAPLRDVDSGLFPLQTAVLDMLEHVMTAKDIGELAKYAINSTTISDIENEKLFYFPLYHRAMPTKSYSQVW